MVVGSLTVSNNHLPQVIKCSWKIQYFVLKHEALPILSSVEKKPLFFRPLEEAGIEPRQNHTIWLDGQTYSALPTIHSAATGEWLMTHQWLHHSDPLLACLILCTRGSWPWNACWRFRLQILFIYPNLTRQAKQPVDEIQFKQMTYLNRKCWSFRKGVWSSVHVNSYWNLPTLLEYCKAEKVRLKLSDERKWKAVLATVYSSALCIQQVVLYQKAGFTKHHSKKWNELHEYLILHSVRVHVSTQLICMT